MKVPADKWKLGTQLFRSHLCVKSQIKMTRTPPQSKETFTKWAQPICFSFPMIRIIRKLVFSPSCSCSIENAKQIPFPVTKTQLWKWLKHASTHRSKTRKHVQNKWQKVLPFLKQAQKVLTYLRSKIAVALVNCFVFFCETSVAAAVKKLRFFCSQFRPTVVSVCFVFVL